MFCETFPFRRLAKGALPRSLQMVLLVILATFALAANAHSQTTQSAKDAMQTS